jgi:hypothetical protein
MMKNNQPKHVNKFGKDYGDWTEKEIGKGSINVRARRGVINNEPTDTYEFPDPIKSTNQKPL